jgi:hypothetical protein
MEELVEWYCEVCNYQPKSGRQVPARCATCKTAFRMREAIRAEKAKEAMKLWQH